MAWWDKSITREMIEGVELSSGGVKPLSNVEKDNGWCIL